VQTPGCEHCSLIAPALRQLRVKRRRVWTYSRLSSTRARRLSVHACGRRPVPLGVPTAFRRARPEHRAGQRNDARAPDRCCGNPPDGASRTLRANGSGGCTPRSDKCRSCRATCAVWRSCRHRQSVATREQVRVKPSRFYMEVTPAQRRVRASRRSHMDLRRRTRRDERSSSQTPRMTPRRRSRSDLENSAERTYDAGSLMTLGVWLESHFSVQVEGLPQWVWRRSGPRPTAGRSARERTQARQRRSIGEHPRPLTTR